MAPPNKADLMGNRYGHLSWRQRVIVPSTVSAAGVVTNLTAAESGALIYVDAVDTSQMFVLPQISSKELGINYEFVFTSQADVDDVQISCTAQPGCDIDGIYTTGSTVSTAVVAAPASIQAVAEYCKVVAISSRRWQLLPGIGAESTGDATILAVSKGVWVAGTANPS